MSKAQSSNKKSNRKSVAGEPAVLTRFVALAVMLAVTPAEEHSGHATDGGSGTRRPTLCRGSGVRVAPRIVRIYTLRGFESVLAGSVQVSTGTKTSLSFQDGPVFTRVHRREGPAAPRGSDAGSSRENSYTPSPGASTTADWADWISATSNAKPARRAACFSSSQLSSIGRFGRSIVF